MKRNIPNARKLNSIRKLHAIHYPDDPFIFSMNEAYRIRQLIGQSLVSFFRWLANKNN